MASGHRLGFAAMVLTAVGTAGCTMCPDPFDYSGPVSSGSVTQNDFAARYNGILPLRAAPSPWPRLVEDEPTPAVQPTAEDEESVVLANAEAEVDVEAVYPEEADAEDADAEDNDAEDTDADAEEPSVEETEPVDVR